MFIPDPGSEFFPPRSEFFPFRIPDLQPLKIVSKLSEIWSGLFIPDPGVKKTLDPESVTLVLPEKGQYIVDYTQAYRITLEKL